MRLKVIIVGALLALTMDHAIAAPTDNLQTFTSQCSASPNTDYEFLNAMYCLGYLSAWADAAVLYRDIFKVSVICMPQQGVPNETLMILLKSWATRHANDPEITVRIGVISTLLEAYPCK